MKKVIEYKIVALVIIIASIFMFSAIAKGVDEGTPEKQINNGEIKETIDRINENLNEMKNMIMVEIEELNENVNQKSIEEMQEIESALKERLERIKTNIEEMSTSTGETLEIDTKIRQNSTTTPDFSI